MLPPSKFLNTVVWMMKNNDCIASPESDLCMNTEELSTSISYSGVSASRQRFRQTDPNTALASSMCKA